MSFQLTLSPDPDRSLLSKKNRKKNSSVADVISNEGSDVSSLQSVDIQTTPKSFTSVEYGRLEKEHRKLKQEFEVPNYSLETEETCLDGE